MTVASLLCVVRRPIVVRSVPARTAFEVVHTSVLLID